ncbi:hypothetical protein [Tabrizicola sp.]|uniref:hypothetical protein n=1 Tax=Tabrizicola sp. TaxID=2005166 RepID=UPI0035B34744
MILRLVALWAAAAGTLLLHALLGIPGDYLGQGFPLHPGLTVTVPDLALTALATTLPIPLVAALARRFHLRWLALPPIAFLWLWAAMVMIEPFAVDFGTTWRWSEPLRALFLHPVHTPVALLLLLATATWTFTRTRRT